MNNSPQKHLKLCPVAMNPFWDSDGWKKQHMTIRLTLDHKIDGSLLQKAYEETLNVWPLLKDAFVKDENDDLYFVENKEPVTVHNSETVVAPGYGLNADRILAVTYYDNTATFSGMHSYFDAGSVLLIMQGTLCRYMAYYFKDKDMAAGLPTQEEGNQPGNYGFYGWDPAVAAMPFKREEAVFTLKSCLSDERIAFSADHKVPLYEIYIPSDEFMAYCKKNSASPSVMTFILFAKAAFALNPDSTEPVAMNNTMNLRHILGIDNAVMGQSMGTFFWAERDDLTETAIPETAKKLKALMNTQRGLDYVLSMIEDMRNGIAPACAPTATLGYLGKLNYGKCTEHIKHLTAFQDVCESINMLALDDAFYMEVQLGTGTALYAEKITELLQKEGIHAEIIKNIDNLPSEIRS